MKSFAFLLAVVSGLFCASALAEPPLRLQCPPSLMPLAKDLIRPLHEEGIEVQLVNEAGNAQVAADLSAGDIDVALLSRRLKIDESVSNPAMHFVETTLGTQVVAVMVASTVWTGGVHALKRDQIANLYENRVHSWKEVGGEDRPMVFFEPGHDKGFWEIFVTWLYNDIHLAPGVAWQVVADGPDMKSALEFASGGISVGNLRWADRKVVYPLALIDDSGKAIEPTKANILDGSYPLTRPVVVVFPRQPAAEKKKMLEFLVSEKGQQIIGAHEFIPQSELKKP
jgi:phosphate transport system substrate-binding protein